MGFCVLTKDENDWVNSVADYKTRH